MLPLMANIGISDFLIVDIINCYQIKVNLDFKHFRSIWGHSDILVGCFYIMIKQELYWVEYLR